MERAFLHPPYSTFLCSTADARTIFPLNDTGRYGLSWCSYSAEVLTPSNMAQDLCSLKTTHNKMSGTVPRGFQSGQQRHEKIIHFLDSNKNPNLFQESFYSDIRRWLSTLPDLLSSSCAKIVASYFWHLQVSCGATGPSSSRPGN